MVILPDIKLGRGAGSSLPLPVLLLAGISTLVAVVVSGLSIWLQLRNYRKPFLQRMVVRIMVMVPIYAVASFISLFSLEAAFFIDVIRDIYEAFVIYCFFVLLLDYLGGERSLLILLHGRPPILAIFPVSLWRSDIDASDPYTYLFLKRGILQYVQVKPLLAITSMILKATGTYHEGDFRARSGYLYVSIVYNVSICLALWCLAVFWMCVNDDLKPFRPVPKFLCVKGILFFSFWQSIIISTIVAVGVITRLGPYTDSEHISLGLTDTLICLEMPFFAAAHMYAFSYRDFVKPPPSAVGKDASPVYVARMRLAYALRDACGLRDLVADTRATLRGEGINYRAFEPSEGGMHVGAARERRIRAGLRYSAGGKKKYWLPEVQGLADNRGESDSRGLLERITGRDEGDVLAPLLVEDAADVIHDAPDMHPSSAGRIPGDDVDADDDDEYALRFSDALAGEDGADEMLYEHAKNYVFGDYLYPVVDVSSEDARRAMWEEEARVVREVTSGGLSRGDSGTHGKAVGVTGYGATQNATRGPKKYEDDEDEGFASEERAVDFEGGRTKAGIIGRVQSRSSLSTSLSSSGSSAGHQKVLRPSGSFSRSTHTSSPPRSRKASDARLQAPPISSASRSSSHQNFHSPSPLSRLHLPSSSSRHSKSPRMPLAEDDAVDLVVPTTDSLYVPSTSRTPHSPHSPALIRVWDETGGSIHPTQEPTPEDDRSEDRRFVLTVDAAEADDSDVRRGERDVPEVVEPEDIVREQTPPPHASVDYHFSSPEEVDNNPWA
ncbi:hypothetical protein HYDPIDRAFT_176629 [Hydnomerulius pinastri MD-312]|uniref:DUF300-domain-containing protein n=1 Tax=Hydnomerulius pinastri MD-312 TaxID=994086 RepID=A0A0C9WDB1_9AGAM|nr:hypothetical protein HYDPIDRAFT_176629 [Hydnomerulius pinastri MD-312]